MVLSACGHPRPATGTLNGPPGVGTAWRFADLSPLQVGRSARPTHPLTVRYAAWPTRSRRSRAIRFPPGGPFIATDRIRPPPATLLGPPGVGEARRSEDLSRSGWAIQRDRSIRPPSATLPGPPGVAQQAIRGLVPLWAGRSARPIIRPPSATLPGPPGAEQQAIRGLVPLWAGRSAQPIHPSAAGYAAWPTRRRRSKAIRAFFPLWASHSAGRPSVLRARLLNAPSGRASISSFVPSLGGPISA